MNEQDFEHARLDAAEPWPTSREVLAKLPREQPGNYPDGLIRTPQRRVKAWRRQVAHRMAFGTAPESAPLSDDAATGMST